MKSIRSRLQSACCLECSMTWQIIRGSPLNRECASLSDKMAPAHRPKHTGQSFAFQWGWEMFLASRFDPFNGEFLLIVRHELAGPYPSILLDFSGYFWAQSLHYQFLSFKKVAFFVFLRTAISSFTPLCFHLVLKRAPRFLSPVRHVDLSQGRARKAYWSMAVLGDRQKFFNLF